MVVWKDALSFRRRIWVACARCDVLASTIHLALVGSRSPAPRAPVRIDCCFALEDLAVKAVAEGEEYDRSVSFREGKGEW